MIVFRDIITLSSMYHLLCILFELTPNLSGLQVSICPILLIFIVIPNLYGRYADTTISIDSIKIVECA